MCLFVKFGSNLHVHAADLILCNSTLFRRVPGLKFGQRGIKRSRREADRSPPSISDVKKGRIFFLNYHICLHDVVFNLAQGHFYVLPALLSWLPVKNYRRFGETMLLSSVG